MKREVSMCLSLAAVSFALFVPQFARAKNLDKPDATQNSAQRIAGQSEAMKMVSARAVLTKDIDARNTTSGKQIRAKLSQTAHLKNGTELPSGTILIGTIAADDLHAVGESKLTLRFTKAELKDGKIIPIKATIVGVFPPEDLYGSGFASAAGDRIPNTWNDHTLKIDQLGALSGVDLHSAIASSNSGTLVSTKKKDFKLPTGSEFALAIAAQLPGQ